MTDELPSRHPDRLTLLPVVRLGESFPTFQKPLERWHGYGLHLSVDPGVCSSVVLQSKELPDLKFLTILQNYWEHFLRGEKKEWHLRVEADKRGLKEAGLIRKLRGGSGLIRGRTDIQNLHIFEEDALEKVNRLKVEILLPEGRFTADPSPESLKKGELKFDEFKKVDVEDAKKYVLTANPNDSAYLHQIAQTFRT